MNATVPYRFETTETGVYEFNSSEKYVSFYDSSITTVNANTTNSTIADPAIETLNKISKYLWRCSIILILLGVFGNLLNLAVARKMKFWRRTPLFLVAVLAIADITVLLSGLLRYWIMYTFDLDVRTLSHAGCKTSLFVIYFSMQFSSWILVLMSIDRFFKTNFPFKYMRIVTVNKAFAVVAALFVILIGVNLHFFFTNAIVDGDNGKDCDDINQTFENFEEYTFVYVDLALLSAVPFIIMVILNIFIFRALREHEHFRRQSAVSSRKGRHVKNGRQFSRKLTTMLLFVSIYFLISTVPISVYYIWDSYEKFDDDLKNAKKDVAWTVMYIFQYSNYSLNFIWYASKNQVFKEKMKEIFGFKPKGFRYQNTTRRRQNRSSSISHMTTSLDNSVNEMMSEAAIDYSENSEDVPPQGRNEPVHRTQPQDIREHI